VLVYGEKLPLIGLLDQTRLTDGGCGWRVTHAGELRTPDLMRANREDQDTPDTLEDYVHYPCDQVAVVPLKFAQRLGAPFRSVAVRTGPEVDVKTEAEGYARRSNTTILASDGKTVDLYASLDRSRINAGSGNPCPVLLAFLMVLGNDARIGL